MARDRADKRATDDETNQHMDVIQRMLEQMCARRVRKKAYGEVTLTVVWVDGRIKEFRIDEGTVVRDPAKGELHVAVDSGPAVGEFLVGANGECR